MTSGQNTNSSPLFKSQMMIMFAADGSWYPIQSSGTKSLLEEAADHGELNTHLKRIEDIDGCILWVRQ